MTSHEIEWSILKDAIFGKLWKSVDIPTIPRTTLCMQHVAKSATLKVLIPFDKSMDIQNGI